MLRLRGGIWYGDIRHEGRRLRPSFHTADRKVAEAKLIDFMAALENAAALAGGKRSITLGAAFTATFEDVWRGKRSVDTVRIREAIIYRTLPADTPIDQIDREAIQRLIRAREQAGNALATVNRVLAALRRVLKWAADHGHIPSVPPIPHFTEPEGRIRVLSQGEEELLYAAAREHYPDMLDPITILLGTGMRLGELLARDRMIVHRDTQVVELVLTKNGSTRRLPCKNLPGPYAALMRYLQRPPMTKDAIEWRWQVLRRQIGLENDPQFVLHMLRHTFATRTLRANPGAILQVQRWMGHKDLATTRRYTHLVDDDLEMLHCDRRTPGTVTTL